MGNDLRSRTSFTIALPRVFRKNERSPRMSVSAVIDVAAIGGRLCVERWKQAIVSFDVCG